MMFFTYFVRLVSSFVVPMLPYVTMFLAAGLLFACPAIVRGIIDHV